MARLDSAEPLGGFAADSAGRVAGSRKQGRGGVRDMESTSRRSSPNSDAARWRARRRRDHCRR